MRFYHKLYNSLPFHSHYHGRRLQWGYVAHCSRTWEGLHCLLDTSLCSELLQRISGRPPWFPWLSHRWPCPPLGHPPPVGLRRKILLMMITGQVIKSERKCCTAPRSKLISCNSLHPTPTHPPCSLIVQILWRKDATLRKLYGDKANRKKSK